MKTRNNQLLVFALFALFLFAGNVKAEGTERKTASSLEDVTIEPALDVENWMLDDNYWINSDLFENQQDNVLNLEEWMTNDSFFQNDTLSNDSVTDGNLEIESWMYNSDLWDTK